ncbi:hypothetical protein RRG08_046885 [Elysia crispata]|uniref:Uncharacterized protein n=1 Tax=Elysia crispata TaxID=231223 RepID=A0AAE0ZID8_9GAST|nr:hypothetical protein RRG08_046885 [Elysia crispata]
MLVALLQVHTDGGSVYHQLGKVSSWARGLAPLDDSGGWSEWFSTVSNKAVTKLFTRDTEDREVKAEQNGFKSGDEANTARITTSRRITRFQNMIARSEK